jgi:hypothetical protein
LVPTRTGVSFDKCKHLKNSFNKNLPIKRGKDGQEVHAAAARDLMQLMDENAAKLARLRAQTSSESNPETGRG